MTSELIERVARIIANAMGDNYSDAFKNKERWIAKRGMSGGRFREVSEPMQCDYLAAAKAAIAAVQADAAPVAWLVKHPSHGTEVTQQKCTEADLKYGWTETPLYAHPPVDDRVSTSSPIVAHETPETSGKLRDAVRVWLDAFEAYNLGDQAAAAIIEKDREAVRAEQAAEIAALKSAWEAQHKEKVAERAEAKLWFEQAQEAKTELAKFKALAETLAGVLEAIASTKTNYVEISKGQPDRWTGSVQSYALKTLLEYKEKRDETSTL